MEKMQLKVSESEYGRNLGVAASAGAAIGGAADAAFLDDILDGDLVERLLQQQLIQQEYGRLILTKVMRCQRL